jgi:hypothetical protein
MPTPLVRATTAFVGAGDVANFATGRVTLMIAEA